ncbi:hypothetical protein N7463_004488 [Penicillium fimorum]|uniref:Uncharacterized protein n=1 Tax=Penicillium fimorum TaxID=1882269 RepID=A0A9W9Y2X8_9EURO|nr:hypothetical protein N7463_004488 [Penicillium fimorum]
MVWLINVQTEGYQMVHDSRLLAFGFGRSNFHQKRITFVICDQRIKPETYQIVQAIGVIATTMQESSAI